jgi:hypothetical protein
MAWMLLVLASALNSTLAHEESRFKELNPSSYPEFSAGTAGRVK